MIKFIWMIIISIWIVTIKAGLKSGGGYYLKLFDIPSVCPFNSICLPYYPGQSDQEKTIALIDLEDLSFIVSNFIYSQPRGRLKGTYKCGYKRASKFKVRRNFKEKRISEPWCLWYSDTGAVSCQDSKWIDLRRGRRSKHAHVVPKSCIIWRSSSTAHKVFFKTMEISFKDRDFSRNIRVQVSTENIITQINDERKLQKSWKKDFFWSETDEKFNLSLNHGEIKLNIKDKINLRLKKAMSTYQQGWHLEMKLDYINQDQFEENLNKTDLGLLYHSQFLFALKYSLLSISNGEKNCNKTENQLCNCSQLPHCHCSLSVNDTSVPILTLRNRNPSYWRGFPQSLRQQGCCDWLLGRMNAKYEDLTNNSRYFDSHFIYFSNREACPKDGKPLQPNNQCAESFCCNKNQQQIAEWNHQIRGKCWIIRDRRSSKSKLLEGNSSVINTKTTISVSAAYGIIVVTTVFVLTFRAVTKKLDSCGGNSRKALRV